jgi:hypothetical protein
MNAEINWSEIHLLVSNLAESFDHTWRKRKRKIGTGFLIIFLMKLCFSRSQSGYQIILDEMCAAMKESGLIPPLEKPVVSSSVCAARKKLDPLIIHQMNRELADSFLSLNYDRFRWNGRRLFIIDGSTLHLPPTLKAEGFGTMNPKMPYPQGKLSVLLHAESGIAIDILLDNKGDERELAKTHLQALLPEDTVLYDRGYYAYTLAKKHIQLGIDAIFRMPSSGCAKAIQEFIDDPKKPNDAVVCIQPPPHQIGIARKNLQNIEQESINLRLIRYFIDENEYILATTILESKIKPIEFGEIYHKRWEIEEHYKAAKGFLTLEFFHSKSLHGVLQEIYTAELLLTMSRLVAIQTESINSIQQESQKKARLLASQLVVRIFSRLKAREQTLQKISVSKTTV